MENSDVGTSIADGASGQRAIRAIQFVLRLADAMNWLPPLLIRLFVGYFFFETGWGKLHNLDAFTQRFVGWGIPWPGFMAPLSAWTELIGGALTVLGLGTRLVCGPMIINMLVAILAVNLKSVSGLDDFVELDEPLYALCYFWLMVAGPGWVSLDYLIIRSFSPRHPRASGSPASVTDAALEFEHPRISR